MDGSRQKLEFERVSQDRDDLTMVGIEHSNLQEALGPRSVERDAEQLERRFVPWNDLSKAPWTERIKSIKHRLWH